MFGRLPEPGRAKTRLIPALGAEGAAALYQAFLDDALRWMPEVDDRELWVPDRPGALETLRDRYPEARIRTQPAGSLGRRLHAAFAAAFAERVDHAVVVGSDHPTLPPDCLRRAFRGLRGAHLMLGPTSDGGYYALGLRRYAWPGAAALFEDAPWSTPDLLAWTRRCAARSDLCHAELPSWYDVDRPEDLARMVGDLAPGSATWAVWRAISEERREPVETP